MSGGHEGGKRKREGDGPEYAPPQGEGESVTITIPANLVDGLDCPVCKNPFGTGVILTCARGCSTCSDCVRKWNTSCPNCRGEPPRVKNVLCEMILGLRNIKCSHAGCEIFRKASEMLEHEKLCVHRPVPCPLCNEQVRVADMEVHVSGCTVLTPYETIDGGILVRHTFDEANNKPQWTCVFKGEGSNPPTYIFRLFFGNSSNVCIRMCYIDIGRARRDHNTLYMVNILIGRPNRQRLINVAEFKVAPIDFRSDAARNNYGVVRLGTLTDDRIPGVMNVATSIHFSVVPFQVGV